MKTNKYLKVLLFAALGGFLASPLPAASRQIPATMYRVSTVMVRGEKVIDTGTTRLAVERCLGQPHHQLGQNVWIYHNFGTDRADATYRKCSSLVIIFASDQVTSLSLLNETAVTVITAQTRRNPVAIPTALVATAR